MLHLFLEHSITPAWDSFKYKKPSLFIAGGTGITPFIAIIRDLVNKNIDSNNIDLLWANKTHEDIFLKRNKLSNPFPF